MYSAAVTVNAQHTLYTADIDIPLIVYQPGVGQIFVLDSSVRLSEENELLFLYKPGEKQIIRTYPYFAPLVALHHVDFGKQVGRDVRLLLGNGVVVDKVKLLPIQKSPCSSCDAELITVS